MSGVAVYTMIDGNKYHHRMVGLEVGAVCPTHQHRYDHVTTVHKGSAKFWSEDGGERVLSAGDRWIVPAGVAHDIEFLEVGTIVECVHTLRFEDGSEVPFSYELAPRERIELTRLL